MSTLIETLRSMAVSQRTWHDAEAAEPLDEAANLLAEQQAQILTLKADLAGDRAMIESLHACNKRQAKRIQDLIANLDDARAANTLLAREDVE